MLLEYIRNLFHCKKEKSEKDQFDVNEVLEENISNNWDSSEMIPESIYRDRYRRMVKKMGLDNIAIEYKLYSDVPKMCMYKDLGENNYEMDITVHMTCDSQERCYKANLAHELWHVKTGMELIRKIGLDEFVKLQRGVELSKTLAFKTLSEYHSWYKAISEYDEQKCNFTLAKRLVDYKEKRINEVALCDNIAAHCAWNVFYKLENSEECLSKEEELFVKGIMQIIIDNSTIWPLSLECYEKIGKDMLQMFFDYLEKT